MNKKDFMDWLRGIIIVILLVSIIVGVLAWAFRIVDIRDEKACEKLGEQIGYNTQLDYGVCRIEIRPHVWVGEHELVKILFLIDCEKGKE